jgi:SAM-dependent methyltransferase
MRDHIERRTLFDTVADEYDELRPSYPEALAEEIVALSGIPSDGRILEVGTGTGQATRLFARKGYSITSLELGPTLAAKARENLRSFPNAEVLNVPFEEWVVEQGAFDLAISASAFHWIPSAIGFPRCAAALKPGGSLAVFWNSDPRPSGGVYDAVQEAYSKCTPEMTRRVLPGRAEEVHFERIRDFAESRLFEEPVLREYSWSRVLSAADYVRLCCTYSDHIALPEDRRAALCQAIKGAIEAHGGKIERLYLTRLYIARASQA